MPSSVITTVADAAGRTLAAMTSGIAALRSADKPLHPEGEMRAGTLVRTGAVELTGASWLDDLGQDDVLVRVSHAIGLPGPVPDIEGLALRIPSAGDDDRYGDVLLATTGWNPLMRHVLVPAWSREQTFTTLLPYRTLTGPVVLGARPLGPDDFELSWARLGKDWQAFGALHLAERLPEQTEVSFDPVLHVPDGLEQYPWVERLRERSYATARRARREPMA
ncbi:hypothetical protein JK386_12665 [Nocardioides sp. zg-536]|uniref:Phosphodiesterase n=1 Tax=Nocardioides faecalis TaxID=2803858 RepID=A0A938Y636_9ACTN|nr:hypothetical protein [Nocardioides faecalis]MBM9460758.1 hypothetical protein [Nocardioides faecalis]MBS4752697.1 hypothetical protein [Nocardioides faecalis]QVI57952.1 hypothetical protein KG111_13040 [Nocardioides faecalis]